MSKRSAILAAFLVPVLAVSIASAAPKKKKKPKTAKPAASSVTAPTPAPPPDPTPPRPIFTSKPDTSALHRVEASIASYTPQEAPPPTITAHPDEPRPILATLTSADVPAAAPRAKSALDEGFSLAPVADFATSKVYGLGMGARVGYTHSSRVYFGGTMLYNVGGTNGALTYTSYYFGPELGYNLPLGPIVVRPYVGGGYGALLTTYRGAGIIPGSGGAGAPGNFFGRSATAFFWPGATIFVPLGSAFALGADVRVLFAPGQDSSTATLANNGALSFQSAGASTPPSTALAAGLTASYRF